MEHGIFVANEPFMLNEDDDFQPTNRAQASQRSTQARHNISSEEEGEIAQKAAKTRKENNPDAFKEMGSKGG